METLLNTRTASQGIIQMVDEHFNKLAKGQIAQLRGHNIHIEQTIDKQLRKEAENVMNSAARALKQGMQDVTKSFWESTLAFCFKSRTLLKREWQHWNNPTPRWQRICGRLANGLSGC